MIFMYIFTSSATKHQVAQLYQTRHSQP